MAKSSRVSKLGMNQALRLVGLRPNSIRLAGSRFGDTNVLETKSGGT